MSNPSYAPNPKKEPVYTNLQNKTLATVEAKDIQQLTDPTFIQATNQDALITYNTINQATFRSSGSLIPDKVKLTITTCSDSGVKNTVFEPQKGETWLLNVADVTMSGGSGTTVHEMWIEMDSRNVRFYYYSTGDNNVILTTDTNWPAQPFYLQYPCKLIYEWTNATHTSATFACIMQQIT